MHAPQIIVIVLFALAFWVDLDKYANSKIRGKALLQTILGLAIMAGLLWWGGFWKH